MKKFLLRLFKCNQKTKPIIRTVKRQSGKTIVTEENGVIVSVKSINYL